MTGLGPYGEQLRARFTLATKKFEMNRFRYTLDVMQFQVPADNSGGRGRHQLTLFSVGGSTARTHGVEPPAVEQGAHRFDKVVVVMAGSGD
ncbi:MAG TPA: hypothetical protein VJ890_26910 [Vineibacter sp.]|nr:hypothetical protein [Vineibacter sp.]